MIPDNEPVSLTGAPNFVIFTSQEHPLNVEIFKNHIVVFLNVSGISQVRSYHLKSGDYDIVDLPEKICSIQSGHNVVLLLGNAFRLLNRQNFIFHIHHSKPFTPSANTISKVVN